MLALVACWSGLNIYNTSRKNRTLTILDIRANYFALEKERFDVYVGVSMYYLAAEGGIYLQTERVNTQYKSWYIGNNLASEANGLKLCLQAGSHFLASGAIRAMGGS